MASQNVRALISAAAVFLLALAAPAAASTIMVNGDTPAVYYQRIADNIERNGLPTPAAPVTLRLATLGANAQPGVDLDEFSDAAPPRTAITVSGLWAGYTSGDGKEVWVNDKMRRYFSPSWPFRHEMGHVFRKLHVSDEELLALTPLTGVRNPGILDEVFADAYMGCGYSTDSRKARIVVARHSTTGEDTSVLTRREVMWRVCAWLRSL